MVAGDGCGDQGLRLGRPRGHQRPGVEADAQMSRGNDGTVVQRTSLDAPAVNQRAVAAVQIVNKPEVAVLLQAAVLAGERPVRDTQAAFRTPAHDQRPIEHLAGEFAVGRADDDVGHQRPLYPAPTRYA